MQGEAASEVGRGHGGGERLWEVSEDLVGPSVPAGADRAARLVTGAARAIGRATVEVLAARGHQVVATARDVAAAGRPRGRQIGWSLST